MTRWQEQNGDPTVADGMLDRFIHNATELKMRGDSLRKNRGTQSNAWFLASYKTEDGG